MKISKKLLITLVACPLLFAASSFAADHIDSPSVRGSSQSLLDITDVFAFRSPTNSENIVLVMGVFSAEGSSESKLFDENALYHFYIDTNGDSKENAIIRATFSGDPAAQTFKIQGIPQTADIEGVVTTGADAQIASAGSAKAFAGLADDPFVLDFEGFTNFVSGPCIPSAGLRCPGTGSPVNFFNGLNIAAIVVEFPINSLPGIDTANNGNLSIWTKTFKRN